MDRKLTGGMSVQELENFGKKYRFEIFFVLYLVFATISSFLHLLFAQGWSIILAALGGVLGLWFSHRVEKGATVCFSFVFKQEKATKTILAVGGAVLSLIVAPLPFFLLGLLGGSGICKKAVSAGKPSMDEGKE